MLLQENECGKYRFWPRHPAARGPGSAKDRRKTTSRRMYTDDLSQIDTRIARPG